MPSFAYFLLFFWMFTACTVQKRTVNRGYFVQWHFKAKTGNDPGTANIIRSDPQEEKRIALISTDSVSSIETAHVESSPEAAVYPEEGNRLKQARMGFFPQKIKQSKTFHQSVSIPQAPKEKKERGREYYIAMGIGNLAVCLLTLFLGWALAVFLLSTGDIAIVILLFPIAHVLVMSFFKTLAFFKMSHILKREQEEGYTGVSSKQQNQKIKRGKQIIHLLFLISYILFFVYFIILLNK
ncbi:MAG: hypothetical protein K0R65_1185 [Crocinitomicaceae bacterium]|nr:hypothetical protein [Crocinitomicaceae bacterium]